MLDFLKIGYSVSNKSVDIYPNFKLGGKCKDLMIRGSDFYAVWVEAANRWSTDEDDLIQLVDDELQSYYEANKDDLGSKFPGCKIRVSYMWNSRSGSIDRWHKYCQKQCRDNFHMLDDKLIFSNTDTKKEDYASKHLNYSLEPGETPAWNKLMSTLYDEPERHKIEWVIGAIVSGDSRNLQKFMVLYGAAGTGKSTVINIIQQLFDGYYAVFDAKALGSSNATFALEAFKTNPLVAIQHDGDLSHIEDNTRLNSLVSHELMTVNEKFKSTYSNSFKSFLIMGTNKPVKITDGKSGILRRLIDVKPSGRKLNVREYNATVKQIKFELGGIAYHCQEVYLEDPSYYDAYIPTAMLGASNDFYNFVLDSYRVFSRNNETTLKQAWEMYKTYCDDAKVIYPMPRRAFGEELKNYFWDYEEQFVDEKGAHVRGHYIRFREDKFTSPSNNADTESPKESWLKLEEGIESIFDKECATCPAQYANDAEKPRRAWDEITSVLSDIDTTILHYVRVPENHIVIDFDIKNEKGEKDYDLNLASASAWPATYAEISKGGNGIHLHYIYTGGNPAALSRIYDDSVEVKVFTGNSSLRRKLTRCNDLPISTINSGLPLKGEKKMINKEVVQNEKGIRTLIKRNLNKEVHPGTKPSIDFIYKILEDAYEAGTHYDVSDMHNAVFAFAAQSTHQSDYCLNLVSKMHFKSEDSAPAATDDVETPFVFFDCEVFPNLFLVCWKLAGDNVPVVKMFNPKPSDIEDLLRFKLIGFNNRDYDNHMLYACLMGYSNEQLYELSQNLITGAKNDKRKYRFGEAYNLSYTDIYDFASAGNKKSLKKLEIEMGIHHQELGLPWDEPVDESLWNKVADYCSNDVVATEAAFHYLKGDWLARQILADISGLTVNDTTNSHSRRIVFRGNKSPQGEFNYRNLAEPVSYTQYEEYRKKFGDDYKFRVWNNDGLPLYRDYISGETLPEGYSILPFFPGYKHEFGKSTYLGQEIGEGGRVYAEQGMYGDVWDGDISGQHPATIRAEVCFGPKNTKNYCDIVDARLSVKHQDWDAVENMFDGKLKPYIQKVIDGELTSKELANALKTVVNSAYGLTKASFDNEFRDPRNKDNIVAKRGALFMTLLASEVQKRGYTVCHIKTDSIKIPDATEEIKDFVINFGKEYGYSFETEAEFEKYCLVNDAVYIGKTKDGEWIATGKQFAVPYVFKKLFSHEDICFDDVCVTFSVSKGALYLDTNEKLPDVSELEKTMKKYEDDYKKGKLSDVHFETLCKEIEDDIAAGHDYHFVGRVGQFTPIKPGHGGGLLYRVSDGKYYAASGTTGYRWSESELIRGVNEEAVDRSYFDALVDDAVAEISKYGDFEWFVSDDPYIRPPKEDFINIPDGVPEEIPFDEIDEIPFQ